MIKMKYADRDVVKKEVSDLLSLAAMHTCNSPKWYGNEDIIIKDMVKWTGKNPKVDAFQEKYPEIEKIRLVQKQVTNDDYSYGEFYIWEIDHDSFAEELFLKHVRSSGSHGSDYYDDPIEVIPETISVVTYQHVRPPSS